MVDIQRTRTERVPEFHGAGDWCAWTVKLPDAERRVKSDSTVAAWLLYCPGAHLWWSYWWISVIHLRPIEGVPPAKKRFPEAEYEIICLSQDPDHAPDPDNPIGTIRRLDPVDWIVQFGDVKNDQQAVQVVIAAVKLIMTGRVSPDSDFTHIWEHTIPATAKHIGEGGHPLS
jgi:hypothetical protein